MSCDGSELNSAFGAVQSHITWNLLGSGFFSRFQLVADNFVPAFWSGVWKWSSFLPSGVVSGSGPKASG